MGIEIALYLYQQEYMGWQAVGKTRVGNVASQ